MSHLKEKWRETAAYTHTFPDKQSHSAHSSGAAVRDGPEREALHSIFPRQLLKQGMNTCRAQPTNCTRSFLRLFCPGRGAQDVVVFVALTC